jgi:hypothetical protein
MNRMVVGLGFFSLVAACSSSSSSGSSTAVDAGGTAQLGEACPNGSGDCAPGLLCDGTDPAGGQCYKACTPSVDSTCGSADLACSFEGHCYKICKQTSDCARASQGYVCKDDQPPRGVKFCDAAD